jgi:hypothetical protein
VKPRFRWLTGDVNWLQYGGKWVSQKFNNGEFDYWLVLELINMHDATGEEDQAKYVVELCVVSPDQAGPENMARAFGSSGVPDDVRENPIVQVEVLHGYGISAHVVNRSGSNARKLLHEVRREAVMVNGLFGFYMDKPENKIGSTGWEFIKGDLNSGLARTIASGTIEGRILAKMHGVKLPPP